MTGGKVTKLNTNSAADKVIARSGGINPEAKKRGKKARKAPKEGERIKKHKKQQNKRKEHR